LKWFVVREACTAPKNRSEETGWSADAVGQIGRELLKVANVEGIDAVASSVPGAGSVERVVDSSADPAMIGAGFYRVTIHFGVSVIILKFGRTLAEMSFHASRG
jgi:hypothetical protein